MAVARIAGPQQNVKVGSTICKGFPFKGLLFLAQFSTARLHEEVSQGLRFRVLGLASKP